VVERRRSGLNVVPEKVAKLKAQPGRDLALAGADLAAVPRSGPSVNLRLLETRGFGNGVLLLHYRKE
jgi:hypothetical protein